MKTLSTTQRLLAVTILVTVFIMVAVFGVPS